MRESRTFGKRKREELPQREVNIKYILLTEGTETEPQYFEAVDVNKIRLEIPPIIKILPLMRSYGENGWSNPKKILDRLLLNLEESTTDKISYSTLLNAMVDCLYYSEYLSKHKEKIPELSRLIERIYREILKVSPDDFVEDKEATIAKVTEFLAKEKPRICELIIKNIGVALNEQSIPYAPDIDKICLVVDRDSMSFTSSQFDYVKNTCVTNNVQFYISNPGFELWLLMHSSNFATMKDDLAAKFSTMAPPEFLNHIESLLKQEFNGYNKSKLKTKPFMQAINTAVANEKAFTENIDALKNDMGTNVGLLIQRMRGERFQ
jgi:hypothetical protein